MRTSQQLLARLAIGFLISWGVIFPALHAQSITEEDRSPAAERQKQGKAASDKAKKRYLKAEAGARGKAPLAAVESATIHKIVVRGNKKIEVAAILGKLQAQQGSAYNLSLIKSDVRNLFAMGYFYDVVVDWEVGPEGGTLTYTVAEKPTITEIEFVGNKAIDDDELREAIGIKAYEILEASRVRQAREKIEKMYEEKGFFLAHAKSEVLALPADQVVKLRFEIEENEKVQVKKITFIGNQKMGDEALKAAMQTQEGGFFSFLSNSGSYKEEVFARDIQMLNFLYYNKGFVRARTETPLVQVAPDKKSIYLVIRISEGEQYKIGRIGFEGDLLFSDAELEAVTQLREGQDFIWEKVQNDLKELQAKYGDLGYAFVNVLPQTRIHDDTKTVDITYEFEKGDKVYFGQINVVGNTRTRDKVIRRELKIREGELYNETRKRESVANVTRLGFFDDVSFNTRTSPDRPDVLDIDIVVKERSTGTIHVGMGYSSATNFLVTGQINQVNLLGKGQKLGASLNYSSKQSEFNLNFTEPYLLDTDWSFGFDLYNQTRQVMSYYDELKRGGAIRVGHPVAENVQGIVRYRLDETLLELRGGDPDIYPVETAKGITSSVTTSLEHDTRNDRFSPSGGLFNSVSLEYAGLGGDLRYTRGMASARYYQKVFWEVVWRNHLSYGFISPNGSGDVPFNQLFLLGGPSSLRGFEQFSLGNRRFSIKACEKVPSCVDKDTQGAEPWKVTVPYGGRQQLYYNLEFEFPLIREVGMKGVLFYDIGNAADNLDLSGLRSDVGFGFRWFSPIGPLRFEWGFPLDRRVNEGEAGYQFYFTIGPSF